MPSQMPVPRRARWLRRLHSWHWISSAICLMAMLLFAATGVTLNHAGEIEARPSIEARAGQLPAGLAADMAAHAARLTGQAREPLPGAVAAWLQQNMQLTVGAGPVEWSADEVFISMPRPGGDATVRIELPGGQVEVEITDRGWVSFLNDLHKGRNTGVAWRWFIDFFAVAAIVFCLTGFFIMKLHAAQRPLTWPMLGLGVVLPIVLVLLFVH